LFNIVRRVTGARLREEIAAIMLKIRQTAFSHGIIDALTGKFVLFKSILLAKE